MEINIPITKEKYSGAYVRVLNSVLNLTKPQFDVLENMLQTKRYTLNPSVRSEIRKDIGQEEQYFNQTIVGLKKNRTLIKNKDKELTLNDLILSNVDNKTIQFNFHIID